MTTTTRETICLVEDNVENRIILTNTLKHNYRLLVAINGEQALEIIAKQKPNLILLDIIMPGMDGFEVCKRLKTDPTTAGIPVIFITGVTDMNAEYYGFECGAADFINKPFSPPILLSRVKNHLLLAAALEMLQTQNTFLDRKVKERTLELEKTRDAIVVAMATLAEARDDETGNHIKRTQHYMKLLAQELQTHPDFAEQLTDLNIQLLVKSAPLHDIGKVGIPDAILQKPGPLDAQEFEVMKQHTVIGKNAISVAENSLGEYNAFLRYAHEIAYSHQEKWDGSGYPQGLKGDEIPLSARLMALVDVYDALRCRRVYKAPYSHAKTVEIIMQNNNKHFDPRIVIAFLKVADDFDSIINQLKDS